MESLLRKYAKYFAFGVLVVSVILMTYVIYEISLAKKQFANQLITRSIIQTESDLDNFFERVDHLVYAVEQQYETGFWDDLTREKAILHAITLIDNYAPVSSIGVADNRGYELNILPDSIPGHWLTRRVFVERWGFVEKWNRWKLDGALLPMNQWEDTLSVDPRERPWFKGALDVNGEIFWTNPYEYTTGPEIGITASIQSPNDQKVDSLFRIIALDLTLKNLNLFIDDLQLTKNQNIYLLTGDNSQVIALHNYSPDLGMARLESALLLSPEELGNLALLNVLNEKENQRAFSFDTGGKTWWGILRPYYITDGRKINIVSVLPEEDFALEITRTLWVGIGSFFFILVLSLLVVWNHNKLHRISNILAEKNKLISNQKKFLFSEVHHRVKNNLALISAFMELELLKMEPSTTARHLRRNQQRIRVIAIIQEEAYKSKELGSVPVENLVSGIITCLNGKTAGSSFRFSVEEIEINVNQALTYGLLLNELLNGVTGQEEQSTPRDISIDVIQNDSEVITHLHMYGDTSSIKNYRTVLDESIIQAFLTQLNADIESSFEDGITCSIRFVSKAQKGIMSSKYYKS